MCVCVRACFYLILFPTPRTINKHERTGMKGEVYVSRFFGELHVVELPASSSADDCSFPLTFPTSCYQLGPSSRAYLSVNWLSDFSPWQFLLWCYSFLLEFISKCTFSGAWAISRRLRFIHCTSPSFILFIRLHKHLYSE